MHLSADSINNFSITLSNKQGQKVVIGYDKDSNQYYLDRRASGKTAFEKGFAARHTAPRLSSAQNLDLTLVLDVASIELFADKGLTVMTQIFFPDTPYSQIALTTPNNYTIKQIAYSKLRPINFNSVAAASARGSHKLAR